MGGGLQPRESDWMGHLAWVASSHGQVMQPCGLTWTYPYTCTGDLYPACCPEGVVRFSKQAASTCNAHISDTPYRMHYMGNNTLGRNTTVVRFMVSPVAIGPQLGSTDCSNTDVAEVGTRCSYMLVLQMVPQAWDAAPDSAQTQHRISAVPNFFLRAHAQSANHKYASILTPYRTLSAPETDQAVRDRISCCCPAPRAD